MTFTNACLESSSQMCVLSRALERSVLKYVSTSAQQQNAQMAEISRHGHCADLRKSLYVGN